MIESWRQRADNGRTTPHVRLAAGGATMVHLPEERPHAGCGDAEGTPPGLQREQLLNRNLQGKQVLVRGQREQDTRGTCQELGREMGWVAEDEVGGRSLFRASHTEPEGSTFVERSLGSC